MNYQTIGDLARADEDVLNSHLGKMGSILWSFANGYDDSPVKLENTHAPIKSVGNSTTTWIFWIKREAEYERSSKN